MPTPLHPITQLDTGPCELFLKLENRNPGGSIKDRMALAMIMAAEQGGILQTGGHLIEATAGNTGIALALVAKARGYKLTLVIPDKMSAAKIAACRDLGAEIIMTRSDVQRGHKDYYQDIAARLATERGALYLNQFSNPANPAAHEASTAPEIWQQMGHKLDAVICGVGTGGTLTGLGRFFKKQSPATKMIVADPEGSILAPLINENRRITAGSWLVEGIGEDFVPDNCDLSLAHSAYSISDAESIAAAHLLRDKEAILGGSSSGTLLAAALRYCRAQSTPQRVVTFVCDCGTRYLDKIYNPLWLQQHGLSIPPNPKS